MLAPGGTIFRMPEDEVWNLAWVLSDSEVHNLAVFFGLGDLLADLALGCFLLAVFLASGVLMEAVVIDVPELDAMVVVGITVLGVVVVAHWTVDGIQVEALALFGVTKAPGPNRLPVELPSLLFLETLSTGM